MVVPIQKTELYEVKSYFLCNDKYYAVPANGNIMNNADFFTLHQ